MNKPILGKDVILQIYKGEGYWNYLCATNVEIDFSMETKETKTVGDGVWKRKRGQSLSYSINLDGILVINDVVANGFDLLEYYRNMVDIQFRIILTDEDLDQRVVIGTALVTNVNLSGGSEGHATGTMTLEGNGPVDILDDTIPCRANLTSAEYMGEFEIQGNFRINTVIQPDGATPITRFDYILDGGGTETAFTFGGSLPIYFTATVPGAMGSSHSIEIIPVCENGYSGDSITFNFTKHA